MRPRSWTQRLLPALAPTQELTSRPTLESRLTATEESLICGVSLVVGATHPVCVGGAVASRAEQPSGSCVADAEMVTGDPDLGSGVVGLIPRKWEDDHDETETAYT